jgi:FkbM family methyltransferase
MKYFDRQEVERIGRAGSSKQTNDNGTMYRYLSSFWLYVEESDSAFSPHGPSGFWEAWVTKWISQELDNHDTFIDVGANVGYYTMLAANHGLKTVAVEPQRNLCEMIKMSVEVNRLKNVSVSNLALSEHRGTMNLIVPEGHSGGAWLQIKEQVPDEMSYKVNEVEVTTLDYGFPCADASILMKIDAEGAEPSIIAGGRDFLSRNNVTAVLEWQSSRWPDAAGFADELFALSNAPVSVVDYDGNEREMTPEQLVASRELEMVIIRT